MGCGTRSIVLMYNQSSTGAGSANGFASGGGVSAQWTGGRASLIVTGATFPTALLLQILGLDGATWMTVQSVTANGVTPLDLPSGLYRAFASAGSPSACYAAIQDMAYN